MWRQLEEPQGPLQAPANTPPHLLFPTARQGQAVSWLKTDHRPTNQRKLHWEICHQPPDMTTLIRSPSTSEALRGSFACQRPTSQTTWEHTEQQLCPRGHRGSKQFLQQPTQQPCRAHFLLQEHSPQMMSEAGNGCPFRSNASPNQRSQLLPEPHSQSPHSLPVQHSRGTAVLEESFPHLLCPSYARLEVCSVYLEPVAIGQPFTSSCTVTFKKP